MTDRFAINARDESRGLAVQKREQRAGAVGLGRRHLDARSRQMGHQIEIKRQLGCRQTLVQRQHVTTFFRRHEVIGVFDSRRDRRELDQAADHVAGKPCIEILSGDGRVDGHEKYAAGTYLTGLRNRAENDQSGSRLKMLRSGQAVLKRK